MKKLYLLLLCFLVNFISRAQLHLLDSTFALNGIYAGDTGSCHKIVVQTDGKIVIAGGDKANGMLPIAMRFNANGSIDTSFASKGRFFLPSSQWVQPSIVKSVCLQSDGKIVLGGSVNSSGSDDDVIIIRLSNNGQPDSSFGGTGYIITKYDEAGIPVAANETITSIAMQPDGKIVAYGVFKLAKDTVQLMRYHTDGRRDSSFGQNGRLKLYRGFNSPKPNNIAIMTDGRIVAGLECKLNALNDTSAYTAIRLLPDGSFDTSFDHDGVASASYNLGELIHCRTMCLQPDGKVLLAGYADTSDGWPPTYWTNIIRFDTLGNLDPGFGLNGIVKMPYGYVPTDILVEPNGKIILATHRVNFSFPTPPDNIICNVMADGSIDSTVGGPGFLGIRSVPNIFASSLALQANGKLIVGGSQYTPPHLVLAQFALKTTSIEEADFEDVVILYPNPASNIMYIHNPSPHSITQLSLYSLDGTLLRLSSEINNQLNTEGLPNGIYLLRLQFADQPTLTRKLIIQHY